MRGRPRPDSSCKDSIKRGAGLLSPKGEAATLWWRDRRVKTPAHPHRTRPRPACARPGPGGDDRLARCPARGAAHDGLRERPFALRPRRAALARLGPVQFRTRSTAGRWSAWHDAAPEAEDQPDAGSAERPAQRLAARQPVVGRAFGPDRVPDARDGQPPAGLVRVEPGGRRSRADAADGGRAGDRAARRLGGGREDPARGTVVRRESPARDRPPHRRRERLHSGPGGGDRARRSSSTTCRATAGTTSATTSSSTASARSSRAATAGSRGTCRRARGGVQHRLGRRRGDRRPTARSRSRRTAGARSRRCSPGGSTSRTSIRPRRNPSSRAAMRASPPGSPSSCAPSRATATPGSPTARGRRSTTLLNSIAARSSRRSGCRSCTRRPSAAPSPAWCASGRSSRRRCPGWSTSTTPRATPWRLERHRRQRRLDLGRDGGRCRGATRSMIRSDQSVTACTGRHRRRRQCSLAIGGLSADPADGHAERRRDRGQHDDHVHAEHARERDRARPRCARRRQLATFPKRVEARRRARAPLRPGAASRTASTGSSSPPHATGSACRDVVDAAVPSTRTLSGTLPSLVLPSRPTATAVPT